MLRTVVASREDTRRLLDAVPPSNDRSWYLDGDEPLTSLAPALCAGDRGPERPLGVAAVARQSMRRLPVVRAGRRGVVRAPHRRSAPLDPVGFHQTATDEVLTLSTLDTSRTSVRSAQRARAVLVGHCELAAPSTTLVGLARAGAPLVADEASDRPPGPSIGELGELIRRSSADAMRDLICRERHSVRIRRAARAIDSAVADLPAVSILLATNRPDDLGHALASIARQRYPRFEVLVGLHGGEWDDERVADAAAPLADRPLTIRRFDASVVFGDVLRDLTERSGGPLVTKWDDDDFYEPDHVGDLVAALQYSGATIVGKAAEFVWFEDEDITVRRFGVGAETYSGTLAGGTLLLGRDALLAAGNWPSTPRSVDRGLIDAIVGLGGVTYRTHGFGYVLRRRLRAQTWAVPLGYFMSAAEVARPGLALEWAGIDDQSEVTT